jgi:hypothetical protein
MVCWQESKTVEQKQEKRITSASVAASGRIGAKIGNVGAGKS